MQVSALTSSLDRPLPDAIEQLAALGFDTIDVPPTAAQGESRDRIDRHGLKIGCVGLERDAPASYVLEAIDGQHRSDAVEYFRRALDDTAQLGAPAGYLTPPTTDDVEARKRWCDSLIELADHATTLDIDLCIEHFPRRMVPTAAATLDLLAKLDHDRLLLLVDVGHCLISDEEPADVVRRAGSRLGYIHFDDNDAQDDLHWPLLAGRLTEPQIAETIAALRDVKYQRALCLELNPTADECTNLVEGKALLERWLQPG